MLSAARNLGAGNSARGFRHHARMLPIFVGGGIAAVVAAGQVARRAGRWHLVEGSGHMIHHDRPDAVVAAIREVVEAARAGT